MRLAILSLVAKLMGIQFHVYGLPFGASYQRSLQTLRGNKQLGSFHPGEWDTQRAGSTSAGKIGA